MTSVAIEAAAFAAEAHALQKRRYTGEPYIVHPEEVASIFLPYADPERREEQEAICWVHDVIEDCGVTYDMLKSRFGMYVADGALLLSDLEKDGSRAQRKLATRQRLANAPAHIQDIKIADCMSNLRSLVIHDPSFALVFIREIDELLKVLEKANTELKERLSDLAFEAGKQILLSKGRAQYGGSSAT